LRLMKAYMACNSSCGADVPDGPARIPAAVNPEQVALYACAGPRC
jgi:hypothetical protein